MKQEKKRFNSETFIHIFFMVFSLAFIIPFLYIISISLTKESSLLEYGYKLIPAEFDLAAYKQAFNNPTQIMNSYKVTALMAILAMVFGLIVMSFIAYPLSRSNFIYKKPITFIVFFTMLFGGGLVPSYIINTQYLKLGNSFWVYILPTLAAPYYIIILRTFFQGLPESLVESAKIDGARELRILFQIVLPLSKPVLATIGLFILLAKWNDWFTSLIYIRDSKLYTLQYLLQRILREVEFLKMMANDMTKNTNIEISYTLPTESLRFAMVVIAAGPALVIFPFFQKYFTRGLTIGSVKG